MADPIVPIPHAGPWNVSGSDRRYDWIGPGSSVPGLGAVLTMLDRLVPFTRWMRMFRRLKGIGGDDMDGTVELQVSDCGRQLAARGITLELEPDGRYMGMRDIAGTEHRVEMTVVSETEMQERWSFGIGAEALAGVPGRLPPEAAATGVDLSGLASGLHLESDRELRWTFAGNPDEQPSPLERCCEAVWLTWLQQKAYADGYRDPDLISQAVAEGWDYEQFTSAVWLRGKAVRAMADADPSPQGVYEALWPLIDRAAKAHAGRAPAYDVAASTDETGKITVEVEESPVEMRAILEHERVHQRQIEEFGEAWSPEHSSHGSAEEAWVAAVEDPEFAGPMEYEAYVGGLAVLEDWLRAHCPGFDGRFPD